MPSCCRKVSFWSQGAARCPQPLQITLSVASLGAWDGRETWAEWEGFSINHPQCPQHCEGYLSTTHVCLQHCGVTVSRMGLGLCSSLLLSALLCSLCHSGVARATQVTWRVPQALWARVESFSCGCLLAFFCQCWFTEVLSTVFITFFYFFPHSVRVLLSVIFKMVDKRQHVYNMQPIDTYGEIMRRKQKENKMGKCLREKGIDAARPEIFCIFPSAKAKIGLYQASATWRLLPLDSWPVALLLLVISSTSVKSFLLCDPRRY